jgi:flagellar FliL protein
MEKLAERKAAKEAEMLAKKENPSAEHLADPVYAPLNPPMVVNFSNDPSGFLQIEIQVMARDKAIIETVKANEPAVRSALLMLLAGKTRDDVTTREGKEKLKEEVLSEVRRVIAPYTDGTNVEDVYFTSLIAQ